METSAPAVEFIGIHKKFGEFHAVKDLSFKVAAGSIHAIVGENGAGKSTTMKILFGLYPPEAGTVKVHGNSVRITSPTQAMSLGIGMVHQHFMLAETLTALDNILLFHAYAKPFQTLGRAEAKARLQKLAQEYSFDIDWDLPVQHLSVGVQQRIEILKILAQDSKILILDEPTAVLTPQEVQDLFRNLRKLKSEGRTILIITHKLKEVMAIADEVTVLRSGQVTHHSKVCDTFPEALAEAMVGRKIKNLSSEKRQPVSEKAVLKVEELSASDPHSFLKNLNLTAHSREIVGIAGVEGNGQELLIQSLIHPQFLRKTGQVQLRGQSILHLSPAGIRRLGLAAFPEDRLRQGVLPDRPLYENFMLGYQRLPEYSRAGFLRFKNIFSKTAKALETYDVRPRDLHQKIDRLSGGNQQKLVVARELQQNPDFILAAKPTRGVDIGAIEFIHEQLLAARDRGASVLLISSELDELMTLSDRILVLFKGEFVAEFNREKGFDEIQIGLAMGGRHGSV